MELKQIVAKNIADLRREAGMTQLQLAGKLNYSDKAVSKWESGASIPDAAVLLAIANLFGVTVDYILSESHKIPVRAVVNGTVKSRKHLIITLMSVMLVWFIATAVFVLLSIIGVPKMTWLTFVWAMPISSILLIIFNSIWGRVRMNYVFISALVWTTLASVYMSCLPLNLWLIFVMGIPGQTIICLWAGMKKKGE